MLSWPTGVWKYSVTLDENGCKPEGPTSPQEGTSLNEKLLRTRGNSCLPPFLPGYSGPNLEASSHFEFLFSSRACQADHHRGLGSTWFRQSKVIFFPEAFLQGFQACPQQGFHVASRQHECSLPNWESEDTSSRPRFHVHTQHTFLWFLPRQETHGTLCLFP